MQIKKIVQTYEAKLKGAMKPQTKQKRDKNAALCRALKI